MTSDLERFESSSLATSAIEMVCCLKIKITVSTKMICSDLAEFPHKKGKLWIVIPKNTVEFAAQHQFFLWISTILIIKKWNKNFPVTAFQLATHGFL